MPPTVILVRHGEAKHNIDRAYHLPDPQLSYLGIQQCGSLRTHLQQNLDLAEQVELIVVSPMRRTLETASYAFSWLIKRGVPVLARADWQENSDKPCDTGSSLSTMMAEFPHVDFTAVDPAWPSKSGRYAYDHDAVLQRGEDVRVWLRRRSEKVIAVVTHSAFLRTSVAFARFAHADYRVFEFADGEQNPELVQWERSDTQGGGMGRSPTGRKGVEPGDFREEEEEEGIETATSKEAQ